MRYKFTNLQLEQLTTSTGPPTVFDADSISKAIYGLRLNLFPVETFRKGRYFDPYEAPAQNENAISNILITSDVAMDAAHQPGSNLNGFFIYYPGNYIYCEAVPDTGYFNVFPEYLPSFPENNFPEFADLLLTKNVEFDLTRKFFIRLEMTDGTIYTDSTHTVFLY